MEPRLPAEARAAEMGRLVVLHSPDSTAIGRLISLSRRDVLSVGRGAEDPCALLVDLRLSRSHANFSFDRETNRFRVDDLGSRNGTFVNGRRIQTASLEPDSIIRIGDSVLVFDANQEMAAVLERADQVAKGDLSVLLLGETGTGKEVLARRLHDRSDRTGPFVAVNCAALPSEMIAAELFGHTRGAYSGAARERAGLFRSAQGGTLLLDEIGDMPIALQPMLLRVLQEKMVRPLGSDQEFPVDVRVLAATHADLRQQSAAGNFRPDLLARLSQMTLELPPLRSRRQEILALAQHFAGAHDRTLELNAESAEALLLFSWPLNLRELDSLMALFASIVPAGQPLDVAFLRKSKPELLEAFGGATDPATPGCAPDTSTTENEADRVRRALELNQGSLDKTWRALGLSSRFALNRLMKKHGISLRRSTS
ncbi:MAG TPA: sigma 54-interacting transcriptional regulator [Polyangiaceae bacterium]|nr:sigma 54-interacting transcriptional regulator [Polyangiaceae bacterium]